MSAPFRCTHLVELVREVSFEERREAFARTCREAGQAEPAVDARAHLVELGPCTVKWESHTEAVSHTVYAAGNARPPFSETAIDLVSESLRSRLVEEMFVGVQIEVLTPPGDDDPYGFEIAKDLLGTSTIYGGTMSARTAAVWSSFKLDARGFLRLVIFVLEDNQERLARLVQRLLDLETYRMLAMLALAPARHVMSTLVELEPQLDEVMRGLAEEREQADLESSLIQITALAARAEHIVSAHAHRFAAARAYAAIVERRISEVDDQVLADHQRYTNFLSRSLQPAMRTCEAAETRIHDLAERVSRAAGMVDTMVDLVQKEQNQEILQSMAASARQQVRLQEAVEGFSIVAISYYGVGLLAYGLKSLKSAGVKVDPDLLSGLAAPLVLATVWFTIRSVRRRINHRPAHREAGEHDQAG
jgi:uncharacterized membrane-anchored protein